MNEDDNIRPSTFVSQNTSLLKLLSMQAQTTLDNPLSYIYIYILLPYIVIIHINPLFATKRYARNTRWMYFVQIYYIILKTIDCKAICNQSICGGNEHETVHR